MGPDRRVTRCRLMLSDSSVLVVALEGWQATPLRLNGVGSLSKSSGRDFGPCRVSYACIHAKRKTRLRQSA